MYVPLVSVQGEESWCHGRLDEHDAEVFRFFVMQKGLDPLAKDAKGRSSPDVAAVGKRGAILKLFQQSRT